MAKKTISQVDIDWIERDRRVIDGLDHLGIELVSVNLYQALLPGLTNVTERARYYSFYPWIIHRYAQEGPSDRTKEAWWNWFRPLDFAYALACIAHEFSLGEDLGSSVVGAVKARELVKEQTPSTIIDFGGLAAIAASGKPTKDGAYFKNPEGGFGQYYKNPLKELGVVQTHVAHVFPGVKLSTYAGLKVAETFDLHQAFEDLKQIASEGKAKLSDLASIGGDVHPDSIAEESEEESLLRSLFFGLDDDLCQGQDADHLKWRRSSLLSMLLYVRDCGELDGSPETEFRWACLTKALPDGTSWQLQNGLSSIVEAWGAYQRNDLLNYCLECLFFAALNLLDEDLLGPRELAMVLTEQAMTSVPATDEFPRMNALPARVSAWVSTCARSVEDTQNDPWDESSTWALADRLEKAAKNRNFNIIPALVARVLGRLATDIGTWNLHPFELVPAALDMSKAHEVQLKRWLDRLATRSTETTTDFLQELVLEWVLFRHLRVATRKLANQGVSTFKFRPEEGKLLLIAEELPDPTFTSPRLRQGFRILEDLHYVLRTDGVTKLTDAGHHILEVTHA
jgi:hypothetical protein